MKSRAYFSAALLAAFVLGVALVRPIADAVEMTGTVTCASGQPCSGGTNTRNGLGVFGSSASGNGMAGQTSFSSTSAKAFKSGVVGLDKSTKGVFNAGVYGSSTRGTGVLGITSSNIGVNGISSTYTGVWGQVNGGTKNPTGVLGVDNSSSKLGVGVAGQSNVGAGLLGTTLGNGNATEALLATAPNNGYLFVGASGSKNAVVASLDPNGNLYLNGQVFTSGSCYNGCVTHAARSYGESAASPTIEDSGEGRLLAGTAFVHLDPSFANAIDQHQGYYVLITPEMDTRGLYVAQRTSAGFYVRENQGGRSSGDFAYRIVAHPYGVNEPRLPLVSRTYVQPQIHAPQ